MKHKREFLIDTEKKIYLKRSRYARNNTTVGYQQWRKSTLQTPGPKIYFYSTAGTINLAVLFDGLF